jgi:hypothetical protein
MHLLVYFHGISYDLTYKHQHGYVYPIDFRDYSAGFHEHVLTKIKNLGHTFDVLACTNEHPYWNELKSTYGMRDIWSKPNTKCTSDLYTKVLSRHDLVKEYDGIIFSRFDLVWKPLFNFSDFPLNSGICFITSTEDNLSVNDTFFFVPNNDYTTFYEAVLEYQKQDPRHSICGHYITKYLHKTPFTFAYPDYKWSCYMTPYYELGWNKIHFAKHPSDLPIFIETHRKYLDQLALAKKPKVALCFSGHLRNYKLSAQALQTLFQKWDCFVFLCVWDQMDYMGSPLGPTEVTSVSDKIQKELRAFYLQLGARSVSIRVLPYVSHEHWYNQWKDWSYGRTDTKNRICQFYLMHECNALRSDERRSFDMVIHTRPDVLLLPDAIFATFPMAETKLILIHHANESRENISDLFFMGPQSLMTQFCSMFADFGKIHELVPEKQLFQHSQYLPTWYCNEFKPEVFKDFIFIQSPPCAYLVRNGKFIY